MNRNSPSLIGSWRSYLRIRDQELDQFQNHFDILAAGSKTAALDLDLDDESDANETFSRLSRRLASLMHAIVQGSEAVSALDCWTESILISAYFGERRQSPRDFVWNVETGISLVPWLQAMRASGYHQREWSRAIQTHPETGQSYEVTHETIVLVTSIHVPEFEDRLSQIFGISPDIACRVGLAANLLFGHAIAYGVSRVKADDNTHFFGAVPVVIGGLVEWMWPFEKVANVIEGYGKSIPSLMNEENSYDWDTIQESACRYLDLVEQLIHNKSFSRNLLSDLRNTLKHLLLPGETFKAQRIEEP